jgi:uncharacterized protein YkwD
MRSLKLIVFSAIAFSCLSLNIFAQSSFSLNRERFVQPALKNYSDPELKVQYNMEKTVMGLINRQRAQQGLPALNWNEKAAQVARLHSENMAHYKFFSHRGLDGLMVNDRADNIALDWRAIGENIAYNRGYDDPAGFTVQRWMDSPAHKDNILDRRWKETGIGIITAPDGTYYLTQVFLVE